jgi:signal transduction histidine kinase
MSILFIYQKKQITYFETIEKLKLDHEKNILNVQLEMQEQTCQHISREIHDNISLSLTLAKLNLNTLNWDNLSKAKMQTDSSLEQINKALTDLSDISKSLNSELIISQGLIQALKKETDKIKEMDMFKLNFIITGDSVFMESSRELVIFRIIQEAFNNIIKHAKASLVELKLDYNNDHIDITIADNGKGFCKTTTEKIINRDLKAGLNNMQKRAAIFKGQFCIESNPGEGTRVFVTIPYL